ncbi:MAG: transglycosylase SLT domain-containing protein [Pseudomonadota bacterium]
MPSQPQIRISLILLSLAVLTGCATTPQIVEPTPGQAPPLVQPSSVSPETQIPFTPSTQPEIPAVDQSPDFLVPPLAEESTLPVPKEDLWSRIRRGFALQEMDSPLIKEHEGWYSRRPDYVTRMMNRSQRYLFHIVEEVERRGLPSEIALLPMTESAFNPKAYSSGHASGIWQFIPSTGKDFGLNQNWWYDGRRNVLSATKAALDYLQRLYSMFGSWELALAAYNAGEGTVARAIASNRAKGLPTDYLSLRLPSETRNYVPKLLAIKHIVANPDAFGLTLSDLPDKPFFTPVAISKHIDLALAALFANMTLEEFKALNPAYNTPVITHNDSKTLLLPTTKVAVFNANMKRYSDRQLHSWQAYQAKRGEKVIKIAAAFGMTPAQLRHLNHIQEKKGKLKSAQLLLVPIKMIKPLPTNAQIAATTVQLTPAVEPKASDVKMSAAVQIPAMEEKGQSDSIAQAIAERNAVATQVEPVTVTRRQTASTRKNARTAKSPPAARNTYYIVKRGDTLSGIAQAFRVGVSDLLKWNRLRSKSRLQPGAKIKVVGSIH